MLTEVNHKIHNPSFDVEIKTHSSESRGQRKNSIQLDSILTHLSYLQEQEL